MAFAMFYNRDDLRAMAQDYADARFPGKIKNDLRNYWNSGLNALQNVDTIPLAPDQYRLDPVNGDPDMRIVVVNYGTKAELASLLRQAKGDWSIRIGGIADDIESTAIEPWTG